MKRICLLLLLFFSLRVHGQDWLQSTSVIRDYMLPYGSDAVIPLYDKPGGEIISYINNDDMRLKSVVVLDTLSHTCCDAQGRNVAVPEYKFEDRLFKSHILSRMRDESMNICFISVQERPDSNSIIYVNYVDSYELHEGEIDKIYGVVRAKSCLIFLDGASNEKVFRKTRQKKRLVIQCTQTYPENVDDGIQESFVVKDTGIMRINWEGNRLEPIATKQRE